MTRIIGFAVALILTAGLAAGYAAQAQTGASSQVKDDDFLKGVYLPDTAGLTAPKVKYNPHAKYTSDALRAKIQGVAEVQSVVMPDGSVGRSRIVSSLDKVFGLDAEALRAANQWTFEPGMLNGKAVPVAVTYTLSFTIR